MPEVVRKLLGELEYSEIFIEEGNPITEIGLNHDIYINNQTFEIFKKINDVWKPQGFCGDANINPDWDETDTTKKSYILNKPDVATKDLLQSLEESLNININDLESLIKAMGVIGFNYNEQEHTVSILRPNNTVDEGITFPVCDGLKPGFIDVDTFLQVQQNKQDLIDINENLANKANKSELHNVALTGDYEDLENKPDLTKYYTKEEVDALLSDKLDKALIQIKESENAAESEDINEPMYFYPDP